MAQRALPDLTSRLRLDTSEAGKATGVIKKFGKDVEGHAAQAANGFQRFERALDNVFLSVGKFGPVGARLSSSLGNIGEMSGLAGASLVGGLAGGAAIAGAALGAFALKAVGTYTQLVEKVDQFQDVTGASAEESSRLVAVFEQFGVSSETASSAMFKLSRRATENAQAFKDLGIEVDRNADGTVSLEGTLFNVVKAYNSTEDAAKKNQIAFTAFGKSGNQLIDVLEVNDVRLRQLAATASNVFTQEDIQRVKEYEREQKQLGQDWEHLQGVAGQKLLPVIGGLTVALDQLIRGHYVTSTSIATQVAQTELASRATDQLRTELQREDDELTENAKLTQDAADRLLGLEDASLRQKEAALSVERAQKTYNEALKEHGAASQEAREAELALERAQLSQTQAVIAGAEKTAAAALAAQGLADDSSHASIKIDLERQSLIEVANTLDPGSPLRVRLEEYIAKLQAVPSRVSTTFESIMVTKTSSGAGFEERQHGGPVLPGRMYTVGEAGRETLIMNPAGSGGYVIPNVTAALDHRPITRGQSQQTELLAQQNMLLAAINSKLDPQAFSTAAYAARG